jgi:Rad3-related DNA helicase
MSGTLHSPKVLKEIFGIDNPVYVEAETNTPGTLEIIRTGKEFDCRYTTFTSGKKKREDYFIALQEAIRKAPRPTLVHVNAFDDLPTELEQVNNNVRDIMTRERVQELQAGDKDGRLIAIFKKKMMDILYSTKCARGVDFPGDLCNSIIFTKYPNPNPNETFWKILQRTHPKHFWDFYKDKAKREFLQRLYRALRSRDDHVFVLSPDIRVLNAALEIQGSADSKYSAS